MSTTHKSNLNISWTTYETGLKRVGKMKLVSTSKANSSWESAIHAI